MTLREKLYDLRANAFFRSVSTLVGGTAVAAAITMLVLPILTRLYAPGHFSTLAVFTGLVAIISVAASFRFDVAIPIPDQDRDAAALLMLALLCTVAVSTVLMIGVLMTPSWVVKHFNQPQLQPYLWLVPIGVMLAGFYSTFQFWFVRRKDFGRIAENRITQSVAGFGAQAGLGWFNAGSLGLILGLLINNGVGCIGLCCRMTASDKMLFRTIDWSQMRATFSAYNRFPKYSALEAICNSAGMQLPIIMIAALATGPEAGFLLLALYVMQAPMGLVGNAIAQVYLSRAPEKRGTGHLGAFTTNVFGNLTKVGIGPLIFAGILAPHVFAVIFGEVWRRSGVLIAWMTPWFAMQFIVVPISMALHVTSHQRAALVLQSAGLIIRVLAVYGVSLISRSFISEAYALSGFVFYFAYLVVVLHAADAKLSDIGKEIWNAVPIVLAWSLLGIGLSLTVNFVQSIVR